MWTPDHRRAADRRGLRYPSDLTDAEWALVAPLIRPAKRGGRPRKVDVREVLNAIFYVLSTGCHKNVSHQDLKKDLKEIERQAFRLASAFLMPSTTYPHEVARPSLAAMLALKDRWRVSIKAQIRRLTDLHVIPEEHVVDLYKLYSAKGWNREEPLDREWDIPEPRYLADALNAIVEAGLRTKSDLLAVEFTMSAGDVENLTNLPAGWLSGRTATVVPLRKDVVRSEDKPSQPGIVLPFSRRT